MYLPISADAKRTCERTDECMCSRCELARHAAWQVRARSVVATQGIAPWAHELLGPAWLGVDKGGSVGAEQIQSADLAQRALADVFEQIERLARVGREKCNGGDLYSSAALPYAPGKRVTRASAVQILRMLGDSLDYGRVHLDYLDTAPTSKRGEAELGEGDEVWITDGEGSWRAIVECLVPTHENVDVRVRDATGERHTVDLRDVRKSPAARCGARSDEAVPESAV